MKIVKVLWIDSCNSNMNWTVAEDIEVEPIYINSFGVVVKDTDEFLAIAQNYGNDPEQYSNITTIPKGCIKEVFVIHKDNKYENAQKPNWSEEDKEYLAACIEVIDNFYALSGVLKTLTKINVFRKEYAEKLKSWLKSLKDRVQPQPKQRWKPTEEQLKSVKEVIDQGHFTSYPNALETLYEQLKQL